MKLLLDENLSPRLLSTIAGLFPDSSHIEDCGLRGASDGQIWEYARNQGCVFRAMPISVPN
jgi:predicted nuclease of predicted toxin-antitoxin system